MTRREQRALRRLARMLLFAAAVALAATVKESLEAGSLAINWEMAAIAVLLAGIEAGRKWLAWVERTADEHPSERAADL